jgi:hypothetical protein
VFAFLFSHLKKYCPEKGLWKKTRLRPMTASPTPFVEKPTWLGGLEPS